MSAELRERNPHIDTDSGAEPIDPRRRMQLLEDCRDVVVSSLGRVISEALDRMSDELVAVAMKEGRREAQQALLEAVAVVRHHREDIELRFRKSFADVMERRLFNRGERPVAGDPAQELAILDDAAVEGRIALERLAQRSRSRLDADQVLGIRARLAALLDRDWFEENDHPASPEAVFDALRSALDQLAPAVEVRTALLQAFEPHVSAGLNLVYSNINERLRNNRILPTIKPRVTVAPDSRAPGDAAAVSAAPVAPAAPAGAMPAGPVGADAFEGLMRQISAGLPSARRSAARMLSDPASFGMADLPMPSAEPPLIEALNTLQSMPDGSGGADGATVSKLLDQARAKGSALDQLTIEIVSLVFDYIYGDRRLPDLVKQQLLRLQVVAMKAALIDRSFFARRQHPMRRLIDRISDMATDPDADIGAGSGLVGGIAAIVDWIIEHFDTDLATFEEAIDRLELLAHTEAQRRAVRMAELVREAERLEALSQAQDEAGAEIALRVDAVTPAFVREFLYRWWVRALACARVDPGDTENGWDAGLRTGELLVWSVAPKSPDDIPRLAALLPKLIGSLMKGLQRAGMEVPDRERFFNELLQWHTRAIQDAKLSVGRPRPAAATAPREGAAGDPGSAAPAPRVAGTTAGAVAGSPPPSGPGEARVDALQRGDVIEIDEGDGASHALRLSWISPSRGLYVLTRFPDVGRSFSRAELVALFDCGRAHRAQAGSALDRAIEAIAQPGAA